ncbi:MAG: acyl-ACP--UDP-N-acetylglucosamine O-acyltransferase [Planctomycetota bacterium]
MSTNMAEVHPTAIVDPAAELAADVHVGPFTVIGPGVRIGEGTRILGQCWLEGPTRIGRENLLYPGVRLGLAPQSVSRDPEVPGRGLVIGDRNVLREGVTMHRAMMDEGPTRVGDGNYFMTNSHLGHDVVLGDRCILSSGVVIGGHAMIGDRVNIGGNSAVHQFVRVGDGAMLGGLSGTSLDVPPWFMLTAVNLCGALNLVGMRRSGMDRADIDRVRWVFRQVGLGGTRDQLMQRLETRAGEAIIGDYLAWFSASVRGWCTSRGKKSRGTA